MVSDATARVVGDRPDANTTPPPRREFYRLLSIYNAYRAALTLGLLVPSLANSWSGFSISGYHAGIVWLAGIWLASAILLGGLIRQAVRWVEGLALATVLLDLVFVAFLVQLGAGLSEGLPLLYLVTVAAGAVLITQKLTATAIAALASLAILLGTASKLSSSTVATGEWVYAGLLGSLTFALSLFLQHIVTRLTSAEQRADKASSHIATLEELNQQIIAHMTTGVCRITPDDVIIPMNDAATSLLGLRTAAASQTLDTVSPALAQYVARCRLAETPDPQPMIIESTGKHVSPEVLQLGAGFESELMLLVEDFTTVSETAQMMKLKSLGKLTASIAHEIRNPLTAISHAVQLMDEAAEDAIEAVTLREIVINNTCRVNDIIEDILQLTRPQASGPETIDLATWLPLFIEDCEKIHALDVTITLHLPGSALPIYFDPGNLRRVLVNLLDNGTRHAQQETGLSAATLEVTRDAAGNTVNLDVIDAGAGVPALHLDRLFEPFFTTRPEGSGLGLYLSRELCEANRSLLTYGRTPEGLTRFRVTIPLGDARP